MPGVPRHMAWRMEYRQRPYMRHLSISELQARAKDVFLNMVTLTQYNQVGLPPAGAEYSHLFIRWTHVLEEFATRYGPYPSGFTTGFMQAVTIPTPSHHLAASAAEAVRRRHLRKGTYLVKFGRSPYTTAAFERGLLRISSASSYADPSLNAAIRDDELSITLTPPPQEVRIQPLDQTTMKATGRSISPQAFEQIVTLSTNYYVLCLSGLLAPRLFVDFDADSCLLVHKPGEFIERVRAGFTNVAGVHYNSLFRHVRYIDPLNTHIADHLDGLVFAKHFRYEYQLESRLAWIPLTPERFLDPVDINIGSLGDLCELIVL